MGLEIGVEVLFYVEQKVGNPRRSRGFALVLV